jgi:tyrosyl-tRNA synthetase
MTDLLSTLAARGFVQDATPGLEERLARGRVTAYIGFDPTADSLHVGSLVPVMGLAWLQRFGHTPIALVGGGTGMVGDPSGKREERPILSQEQIDRNARGLARQLGRFLSFEGANAARMRNNADWLRGITLMEFLRDTGKHFTLSYMLQKESVRSRMEVGITYTEFSYMLIQAYDFWHLWRTEQCEVQMGGSDQWGNITAGIELIGRREGAQAHGLVFPLITTAAGAKFGKSESGNIWLAPERTSPYQFYQFWVNADDRDVERYLKLFTFLRLDQIAAAMAEQARDPGRRSAQRLLAREVTATVHGMEAAEQAVRDSEALFGRRTGGADAEALVTEATPSHRISRTEFGGGIPLVDALVLTGLASSKADARRGIAGKGFYVNEAQIEDVGHQITEADLRGNPGESFVLLRKGKRNYMKLVIEAGPRMNGAA